MTPSPSGSFDAGPLPPQVSAFLLELHTQAHELGARAFQVWALDHLATLVPYNGGLLATGSIRDGIPHGHDVTVRGYPPEFMESWDKVKHQDRVAVEVMTNPGRTVNFAIDGPIFDGADEARAHCHAWDLAYVTCTALIDKVPGLYAVMSMYRGKADRPFSETERAAIELVVPHVFAAARQARVGQLRAKARPSDVQGSAAAIIGEEGVILEAEPAFASLLRLEWPAWAGPWIPPALRTLIDAEPNQRVTFERLVIRSDAVDGVRLLHVRQLSLADKLTSREREIAEAYSLGETYRAIGERFEISPHTVRRHLGNIFEKLGISSKVELDRMLSAAGE